MSALTVSGKHLLIPEEVTRRMCLLGISKGDHGSRGPLYDLCNRAQVQGTED